MCTKTTISVIFRTTVLCVFSLPITFLAACEVGRYGANCEQQCNCLNNVMCDEGRCQGLCERGFTGLPYCKDPCPSHKFGLNCHYDCHCADDESCDKVNGDCPRRVCAFEYDGAGCQRRLPRMLRAPSIVNLICNSVTLGWDPFYDKIDEGEGPVGLYIVKTKAENSASWNNPINVTDLQNGRQHYLVDVTTGLVPDAYQMFRIDIRASAHGKLLSTVQPGLPSIPIYHKCTTGCSKLTFGKYCEFRCNCLDNAACDSVTGKCPLDMCDKDWGGAKCQRRLPRLAMPPKLVHHTCNNFTISWNAFVQDVDIGEGPVGQYNLYYKEYEEKNQAAWRNPINKSHTDRGEYVVSVTSGIKNNAEYVFRVDAVGTEDMQLLSRASHGPVNRYTNKCERCPIYKFGENCNLDCHCADDDDCNKTTGHCRSGQCHPSWYGPACQRRLPMLIRPPVLVSSSCMNITISWKAFSEGSDIGNGPVGGYNVMSQAVVENFTFDWVKVDAILGKDLPVYTVSIVREMLVNYEYLFRVDVIALHNNSLIFRTAPGVSTCPILNRCITKTIANEIVSVGRRFIFIVAHRGPQKKTKRTAAYVYAFTPEASDVTITTLTTAITLNVPKSKTAILSPRKMHLYGLAELSEYVKDAYAWPDLIFEMTGDGDFGIVLILEKSGKNLAAMTLLPVAYWGQTYVSFGVKRSQNVYILNERAGNEILVLCSHFKLGHNVTIEYSTVRSVFVDVCKPAHGREHMYMGISLSGKFPFGVITVDILEDEESFCEDVENFISQDMPMPMTAFGTEFITVYSETLPVDGHIVVQALHAFTTVAVYLNNDLAFTEVTIEDHLDVVAIEPLNFVVSHRGARRIKTSHPVQLIFVVRPPCPWEAEEVGDLSHTVLMPDHLFYNEYFVGTNTQRLTLIVTVIMLITKPGRTSLSLNEKLLDSSLTWEHVIAKPDWYVGDYKVSEETNIFKSSFMFGAYVYGYGKKKAYLHSAGYKSCYFISHDRKPADYEPKKVQQTVQIALIKGFAIALALFKGYRKTMILVSMLIVDLELANTRCFEEEGDTKCPHHYEYGLLTRPYYLRSSLPRLKTAPRLYDQYCNTFFIQWSAFRQGVDFGEGPVAQYNLYYREYRETYQNQAAWRNLINRSHTGQYYYIVRISYAFTADADYVFRVDCFGIEGSKILPIADIGLVSRYTNKCLKCPVKKFGLRCIYECHCLGDKDCDKVTGHCPRGRCHPAWYGRDCQRQLPSLKYPPRLLKHSCNKYTLCWQKFTDHEDLGEGPVGIYRLHSDKPHDRWENVMNFSSTQQREYVYTLIGIFKSNSLYEFRIDVVGVDLSDMEYLTKIAPGQINVFYNNCPDTKYDAETKGSYIVFTTFLMLLAFLAFLAFLCWIIWLIILTRSDRGGHHGQPGPNAIQNNPVQVVQVHYH